MIKLLLKYAPDSVVDAMNDISLAELDKRGLIVTSYGDCLALKYLMELSQNTLV